MAGNTHEWTQSVFDSQRVELRIEDLLKNEIDTFRMIVYHHILRVVVRGGGWRSPGSQCATHYRGFADLDRRNNQIGFRLVRLL